TAIAEAVAVHHGASEYVGNRLDPAMRMPRKARQVVLGHIAAKIVEQQERVVVGRLPKTERAPEMDSGALQRGLRRDQLPDRPDRHNSPASQYPFGDRVACLLQQLEQSLTRRLAIASL